MQLLIQLLVMCLGVIATLFNFHSASPTLVILAVVVLLVFIKAVYYVKPSERRVLISALDGTTRTLDTGIHWAPNPFMIEQNPAHSSWRVFKRFPEAGTRLHIDPKPTQVHTSDSISATADVSLDCVVRDWAVGSLIKDQSGCIHTRACTTVNQWLTEQMSEIPAHSCTYGHLNQRLNSPEQLDSLNAMLASAFTYLQAVKVVIDPNGIALAPSWVRQRDEIHQKRQLLEEQEKVLAKEVVLARMERTKQQEENQFTLAAERQRTEHEIERSKLELQAEIDAAAARADSELLKMKAKHELQDARELERMKKLVSNGLTQEQYCRLALAQVHFDAMAQTQGVKYLSVPPHLLGLSPMAFNHDANEEGYQHVPSGPS